MAFNLTPSKRPYDRGGLETNGKGKWQKSAVSYPQLQPLKISPGSTVFRILCPISKSGSVIGKGGTIVSQIREDTGAKVRVEEPIPGDDERVILIVGPDVKEVESSNEKHKEDEEKNGADEKDDEKENNERNEGKNEMEVEDDKENNQEMEVMEEIEVKEEIIIKEEIEVKEESNVEIEVKEESNEEIEVKEESNEEIEVKEESNEEIEVKEESNEEIEVKEESNEEIEVEGGSKEEMDSKEKMEGREELDGKEEIECKQEKDGKEEKNGEEAKVDETEKNEKEANINEIEKDDKEDVVGEKEIDDNKDMGVDGDQKAQKSVTVEGSLIERGSLAAQKALLLVFERMIQGEPENDEGDEESKTSSVVVRLLVLSSQVGCLLGKGGSVIKQMAAESGSQIRVLPRDKLPLCASQLDELVQLTGGIDSVRKALQSVSQQLLENLPRDRDNFPANKQTGPSSNFSGPLPKSDIHPPPSFSSFGSRAHDRADYPLSGPPPVTKYREHAIPNQMAPLNEMTFRLLCYNEKVGGVIGRGGTIVKALQHETGCEIKILERFPDSDDRIIIISGPAHPDDRVSAAQDAVLRVQNRIVKGTPDHGEKVVARILVYSSQIGCILGKGGSIIAEMRKFTGAHIRIVPKDQVSRCASENDEVIQMSGEFESVQEALLQITGRLQEHFFRDAYPSTNHPGGPGFPEQVAPYPSFMGRRQSSPPGMYANFGPPFHNAVGGMPQRDPMHPHDDRFGHNIHRPGLPHHSSGRMPSSAPWEHQGFRDGSRPSGMSDYGGGPSQRRMTGYNSGSQPTIITSTTVEVSVPRAVVPSIYGENGGSLKKIRQISGAKITITEPRAGAAETAVIISGTPEQTHAAQSLLQAFVMSGTSSP